uniref:Uncharacterized protein n=1 Tax=Rhizophora mucronata TaxID=61149 RepID=A0A2P2QGV0_RHIMU
MSKPMQTPLPQLISNWCYTYYPTNMLISYLAFPKVATNPSKHSHLPYTFFFLDMFLDTQQSLQYIISLIGV